MLKSVLLSNYIQYIFTQTNIPSLYNLPGQKSIKFFGGILENRWFHKIHSDIIWPLENQKKSSICYILMFIALFITNQNFKTKSTSIYCTFIYSFYAVCFAVHRVVQNLALSSALHPSLKFSQEIPQQWGTHGAQKWNKV